MRWFTAVGSGEWFPGLFASERQLQPPRPLGIVPSSTPGFPFSIDSGEGSKDLDISGLTPLTSHEALRSLISLCNRYPVSRHQLHIALATAMLLPTPDDSSCKAAIPRPEKRNTGLSIPRICGEDLEQSYSDLPHYITLSCGCDVINSSLCGVFWDPRIPANLASPWLQPSA